MAEIKDARKRSKQYKEGGGVKKIEWPEVEHAVYTRTPKEVLKDAGKRKLEKYATIGDKVLTGWKVAHEAIKSNKTIKEAKKIVKAKKAKKKK